MTDNDTTKILAAQRLAKDILLLGRNSLLVELRFLDMAFSQLIFAQNDDGTIATDGRFLYYDMIYVLSRYKEERASISRDYLHIALHCIFQHLFVAAGVNRELWNLACDIAVENVIAEMDSDLTKCAIEDRQKLESQRIQKNTKFLIAEKIYRYLTDGNFPPEELERLKLLFYRDCHDRWYIPPENTFGSSSQDRENEPGDGSDDASGESSAGSSQDRENQPGDGSDDSSGESSAGTEKNREDRPGSSEGKKEQQPDGATPSVPGTRPARQGLADLWKEIGERVKVDLETSTRQWGDQSASLTQNVREATREKYDYSSFLKRFSVLGEALRINDDEFDYIYYTYGLKLYENIPLIEPLEYKEVKLIKEFVIAIDTSGSCAGELVNLFLQKTYNILARRENFFTKVNIHIIQCDAEIQADHKITSAAEFDDYIKNLRLSGFGGTDFRPVFDYVDELIKKKEFVNLKGLIYFTDGYGDFPAKKPPFETAFVFVGEEEDVPRVPPWAIKLVLRPDEI